MTTAIHHVDISAPREWQAAWIWPRDLREPNTHLLFRRDLELAAVPARVLLHLAAETFARVWINDVEVMHTSSISYPGQHYFETVDITHALRPGVNRISVLAWYIGIPSSASCPQDPGLLAEIEAVADDGTATRILGSDASWRCLRLSAWQGRQRRSEWFNLDLIEIRDDRLLPAGWPTPPLDERFEAPESLPWPGVRMPNVEPRGFAKCVRGDHRAFTLLRSGIVRESAQVIPAMAMSEELIEDRVIPWNTERFTIEPTEPGQAVALIFDLGSYTAGYPALTVSGCPGAVVDVAWHEWLADGTRFDIRRTKVYAADRFIVAAESRIQPEEWKAGRFFQLTFRNVTAPLTVSDLRWIREEYPVATNAALRSSDPTLEKILAIALRAAHLCLHDNIMDCPWREKRQWIGDAQRIGLGIHWAMPAGNIVPATLRQIAKMQDPSGRIWVCLPLFEELPFQSMEWLRAVLEAEDLAGETELRRELAPAALNLHRWFLRCRDANGLFFVGAPSVQNWIDNPFSGRFKGWQRKTAFAAMNLRYLHFLDDVAELCRREGDDATAQRAAAERVALAARLPAAFVDAAGLWRDAAHAGAPDHRSELAHALAVTAGMPGAEAAFDRYRAIADAGDARCIACSPFAAYVTHQALAKLGRRGDIVADILRRWGPMVAAGADTAWEGFDDGASMTLGAASFCHGWSAYLATSLFGFVLGLDPRRPGGARLEGAGGVAWISGEILARSKAEQCSHPGTSA